MSTVALEAVVVTAPSPSVNAGEHGATFTVALRDAPETDVFLPVRLAGLVDEVDLTVGSGVLVNGTMRAGVVVVDSMTALPTPPAWAAAARPVGPPAGRPVGTVAVAVPALARLDRRRRQRHRVAFVAGISGILVLAVASPWLDAGSGALAMGAFLAVCVWLVVGDLWTRRVDDAEYHALAQTAAATLRSELGIAVPVETLFVMFGGGRTRTGDPWHPSRPNDPRPVRWGDDVHGALAAHVTPVPLPARGTATVTVTATGMRDFR